MRGGGRKGGGRGGREGVALGLGFGVGSRVYYGSFVGRREWIDMIFQREKRERECESARAEVPAASPRAPILKLLRYPTPPPKTPSFAPGAFLRRIPAPHTGSTRYFLDDLMDGFSHIVHIAAVQPGHADAPVLGHVDVRVGAEAQNLCLAQAREAEHADLVGDVAPAALAAVQRL